MRWRTEKVVEQTELPPFLTFSQILVHEYLDVLLCEFYGYDGILIYTL